MCRPLPSWKGTRCPRCRSLETSPAQATPIHGALRGAFFLQRLSPASPISSAHLSDTALTLQPTATTGQKEPSRPGFGEALRFWFKLGWISFGGPTGQIAILHSELVERRRWIREDRFLHALNFCMLLPGPEAQQLATYSGWLLHGIRGGLAAGLLFVLPSAGLLWLLSWVYVTQGSVPWVAAVFEGLKPAVLAIVAVAMVRLGRRTLRNVLLWCIAAAAFGGLMGVKLPFPVVLASAALAGWLGGRWWPRFFATETAPLPSVDEPDPTRASLPSQGLPVRSRLFRVVGVGLLVWWLPVVLAGGALGWDHTVFRQGLFFSKAAMVTFGGAYAVLPYVAQNAVDHYGWLAAGQMMDGLGLAETTPGPLVMVLQFVGFMGGWNHPGTLSPIVGGTLGALMTTWVTFAPCFLWILAGAPYVEQLRRRSGLSHALSGVTGAVVGVILNLAVWFGWHVVVPEGGGLDLFVLTVAGICALGLARWRWHVVWVVVGAGVAGWGRHLLG